MSKDIFLDESQGVTYREALSAIEALFESFSKDEALAVDTVEVLAFAVNNDLQIRDFLLGGLPNAFGSAGAVSFCSAVLPLIDEAHRAPFYTLMSAFYYELGDVELATASLVQAEVLNPDYPLAHLLNRVVAQGWPSSTFVQMRTELHPKVVETITSNLDHLVTA